MRRLAAALSMLVLTASCSGSSQSVGEIGIRRIALDLAFSDPALAEPVSPRTIIERIPAPPGLTVDNLFLPPAKRSPSSTDRRPADREPEPSDCPAPGPLAAPDLPVGHKVAFPAAFGVYSVGNEGRTTVIGGVTPVVVPFPSTSALLVRPGVAPPSPGVLGTLSPAPRTAVYEVERRLADSYAVIETLELTDTAIRLLRRTTRTAAGETVLTPDPPVDVYQFQVQGHSWRSAGLDMERGVSMVYEATIAEREILAVCDVLVDTYRVEVNERLVDLTDGRVTGTSSGEVTTFNIAPQLGGLLVREEVHSFGNSRDAATGTPVTIELDYVSVLTTLEPKPEPERTP